MKEGRSKERKPYKKPSYQVEEILEKMSLKCPGGGQSGCKSLLPCTNLAS